MIDQIIAVFICIVIGGALYWVGSAWVETPPKHWSRTVGSDTATWGGIFLGFGFGTLLHVLTVTA